MKSCKILWSTQSGRAKACARRTARILREQTMIHVQDVGSSFDDSPEPFIDMAANLSGDDTFLLLFVSTTGDGEHCDSIRDTWKTLLQKSLPKTLFANQKFAMFCLGDRAYGPQFCAGGRKLAVRLLQLGMGRLCDVGYGDDNTPDGGVFRDLDYWLEEQLLPLLPKREADQNDDSIESSPCPYSVQIIEGSNNNNVAHTEEEWRTSTYENAYRDYFTQFCPVSAYTFDSQSHRIEATTAKSKSQPLLGMMLSNERITAPDWEQDTRHFRIKLQSTTGTSNGSLKIFEHTNAPVPYQAGDIASILPFNSDEMVQKFLNVLPEETKVLADAQLSISFDEQLMNNNFARWPKYCTFRGWLKYCADIHSLPEREDLRSLSDYCADRQGLGKDQSDKLKSLSETSEAALYADYILREKRSWADVLFDFDSLRKPGSGLTIPALMVLLPPIRPREFSIASSPLALQADTNGNLRNDGSGDNPILLELCVSVVEGKTRLGRSYHGLCSKFLSQIVPAKGSESTMALQAWIRPGSFGRLPMTLSENSQFEVPVLCVGAGTGVAPMRSLLLEREAARTASQVGGSDENHTENDTADANDNILVFGCRKEKSDYYYRDEWKKLTTAKRMRLFTAFSRDQFQKIYVQKVLREADGGQLIATHILQRNGAVYIAGGPKMARAVKEEIVEALGKELPGGEKAANVLLNKLQRLGKFSIEAWS